MNFVMWYIEHGCYRVWHTSSIPALLDMEKACKPYISTISAFDTHRGSKICKFMRLLEVFQYCSAHIPPSSFIFYDFFISGCWQMLVLNFNNFFYPSFMFNVESAHDIYIKLLLNCGTPSRTLHMQDLYETGLPFFYIDCFWIP